MPTEPTPLRTTFRWRGYDLEPDDVQDDVDAWVLETDDVYIGVSRETDGRCGACVAVDELEAEGEGATPAEALDAARLELRRRADELPGLVARLLP